MELTCIMCPMGCSLTVKKVKGEIVVTGNSCPRGAIYGKQEVTSPQRIVTSVKQYQNGTICLKTSQPVPKSLVDDCLKEIAKKKSPTEIKVGEIFIKNILKTNADVIVTEVNI